jgi:hypothetical protein
VGLQTFLDLLEFMLSLVTSEGEGVHTDLDALGLGLLNGALTAGGAALAQHPALLGLMRQARACMPLSGSHMHHVLCEQSCCQALALPWKSRCACAGGLGRAGAGGGAAKPGDADAGLPGAGHGIMADCNMPRGWERSPCSRPKLI